jgi:hypothetical protein
MGRVFDITWIGGSIYHGYRVIMGMEFDISLVGGLKYHGKGV